MTSDELWLPRINQALCTGCGDCIVQCPTGALGWQGDKAAILKPDLCIYHASCEDICPVNAIEVPYQIVRASRHEGE